MQTSAQDAQSTQRRFSRWLHNARIHPTHLYGPLIQADKSRLGIGGALPEFRYDDAVGYVLRQTLVGRLSGSSYSSYLAGEASMVVAVSSSSNTQDLLDKAARLLPEGGKVV